MSQIENKMDDFMPFGGEIRSKYPEDDETVQHAIIDACFAALDDIMFPMDDRGKRPSECQVFFAVQRMYGAEGERDYFLLSDADTIPDEHPFTRDGADWGECGGALACKVLSEPPTLLTFHELAPAGVDTLRDEDGYLFDVPSEAVEKVFGDETLTMPSMLTLLEVELKVDDALAELEAQPEATESLDELVSAKTEEASLDAEDDLFNVELCSETYCATLANEASECKYIASALEKMGFDVANDRAIEKHAEIEPKQRIVFDRMIGRVGDSYLEVVNQLDNFFDTDRTGQSEFINDNWGNPILVKGGRDGYGDTPCVLAVYEDFVDAMDTSSSDTGGDNIFADCIIDGIWDENGSLILTGALPDGHATICELLGAHACAEMRQLTDKGGRLYLDHLTVDGFHLPKDGIEAMGFVYRDGDESAFLHDLWDNPEMCSRPRFAEKALDMPTEEYIMYHDGVKTEFQITEVKKDSFAYEQGARYDAKVLTNGHDCGNGRFCADLDEAHEFCQQFADSVVGLGESLDDMCEDRRKVASLAQDVDADNRDQEYNNHDNSEIGE